MKYIGAHVSAAGGVENAPRNAMEIGAKAFALFLKNQKRWIAKPYTDENIENFAANLKESAIDPKFVLPHSAYLINVGNPDPAIRDKSIAALTDELQRAEQLGLRFVNFHPGGHLNQVDDDTCIGLIADAVNQCLSETETAMAVIESTAGQGSHLGYRFEQIADMMAKVKDQSRVGVCLDTCHMFAAGYDLRTAEVYEQTMDSFESTVGFSNLVGIHLNDSKNDFESRKDRHETIGNGTLGAEPFKLIMNDPRLDDIPIVLETPEPEKWKEEIAYLYSLVE